VLWSSDDFSFPCALVLLPAECRSMANLPATWLMALLLARLLMQHGGIGSEGPLSGGKRVKCALFLDMDGADAPSFLSRDERCPCLKRKNPCRLLPALCRLRIDAPFLHSHYTQRVVPARTYSCDYILRKSGCML
jgi:hypothetical protein